jgi:RimJ/RimL family protein N-acetyltransferase
MGSWDDMEQAVDYGRGLLTGPRILLRALTDDDLPHLEAWWLNPSTVSLQANTIRPMPPGTIADMFRKWSKNDSYSSVGFCVEALERKELLGHVALWSDDPRNRAATLAVIIGDEHVGNGYGPEALRILIRYGFVEMGLHRIQLEVYAYNTRAIEVYRKLGFVEEGRRREVVLHDGDFHDEVVMAILEHEWRAGGV